MVYRTTNRGELLKAAMQARILRAAGKLFAAKGYEATTMQDVVTEARTSIGNLYFYFQNKEALMRALLETSFVEMFDATERRAEHVEEGAEKVGTIIALNATAYLTARSRLLDILTADSRLGVVQRLGDIAMERWSRILRAAFPDRDEDELALVAAAIWGVNRSVVERTARGAFATDTRGAVIFMVRWTLRALGTQPSRIDRIVPAAWRLAMRHARELELEPW
jgi:AcrR family transcriptional regulator